MNTITTKVVGVSFEGRQTHISKLTPETKLYLVPEPDNIYDSNAIQVIDENNNRLGYIPKNQALKLKKKFGENIKEKYDISHFDRYGGGYRKNYGLEITFKI